MLAIYIRAVKIKISIIGIKDASFPIWIECVLYDPFNNRYLFIEKIPVVEYLHPITLESVFPQTGIIECELVKKWEDNIGQKLMRVNTKNPWGIESTDGVSIFDILENQNLIPKVHGHKNK